MNPETKKEWATEILKNAKRKLLSDRKEIEIGIKPINVERITLPDGTEIPEGAVLEVISLKNDDKVEVDGGFYGKFEVEKNKLGMPI